jgi:hypothetical protein
MKKFIFFLAMLFIACIASANVDPPKVEIPYVDFIYGQQETTTIVDISSISTEENTLSITGNYLQQWFGGAMPGDNFEILSYTYIKNTPIFLELVEQQALFRCCNINTISNNNYSIFQLANFPSYKWEPGYMK